MRKSKFTDSQIMDAVKRVEAGFGVPDICREMGISTVGADLAALTQKSFIISVRWLRCHIRATKAL
jgi:hypothetical protein